jgi:CubicO group peptidase (beta-lactamase class C family)
MRRIVLPLATALQLLPCGIAAQQSVAWNAATAEMDRYVAADRIVGSALVLVEDGRIIAEHYTGFQDRNDRVPADRNTIWHWGSITKTLTAVAVRQLESTSNLPAAIPDLLDRPAVEFVPELRRIHSAFGDMDRVTIRMLLSHSSGLRNGTWPWARGEPWEPFEPTEWAQLVAMMPYMQLEFAPGNRYGYSNPAFVYLARVMQVITGDPWQGRIYKVLFMPLGMDASYFGMTPVQLQARRSHNYAVESDRVADGGADFDPGVTIPNGGWNAPVTDLARWMGFLAGSADPATQARSDALLPRQALEEMWQPMVRVSDDEEMGLSFFIRHEGGRRLLGHTGTQANFRSFFWMDPVSHRAVVGVVNTSNAVDPAASARGFQAVMAAARGVLTRP